MTESLEWWIGDFIKSISCVDPASGIVSHRALVHRCALLSRSQHGTSEAPTETEYLVLRQTILRPGEGSKCSQSVCRGDEEVSVRSCYSKSCVISSSLEESHNRA